MKSSYSNVDVAVIGAGPAGLAAAIKAKESGAEKVVIVERAEAPGGLLFQCIHNGFGLQRFKEDLTGPEYAHRFIEKARDLKIDLLLSSMVLDIKPDREMLISNRETGLISFTPKSIVLAMGCRERSRPSLLIPGTRPAGIFNAGAAQRLVNVDGFMPGSKFVILGSGDIGMIMARRLTLEGAKVQAMVEALPYVGGLVRNEVQCIRDFNIPLMLQHTVTDIQGIERVEAVTVARVDSNFEPIKGTEQQIECDTLLLSVGLIPENELSLKAGVMLDPLTGGPVVNGNRETSVPGIFAGGNVVHVHDLVDNVSEEAESAGQSAAEFAAGKLLRGQHSIKLKAGHNIRYIVPQSFSSDHEVTLYMRVAQPMDKVRLSVGDIYQKSLRAVRPSEMLKVRLSRNEIDKIGPGVIELTINCEQRG